MKFCVIHYLEVIKTYVYIYSGSSDYTQILLFYLINPYFFDCFVKKIDKSVDCKIPVKFKFYPKLPILTGIGKTH